MVLVKVNDGLLEGETVTNELGGTIYSFKGIPYATPPLGHLRYKAPLPPKPWHGVRTAKQFGEQCPQFNFTSRSFEEGSEDCLYLNVYSPKLKPTRLLPVMIWIHGGGFVSGNANDNTYGPEFLVRHGVILVTINYRLEILGFLCLDNEDVPGNAGIKDQVAAMRWVKNNIANFGGDPDNITLFGQSSGAACVTYHCISPMTKGLFRRAIAQSGSMINWWGHPYRPREKALALAKKLGCQSEDDKELYEFFRAQPVENLTGIQVHLTFAEKEKDRHEIQFAVVKEKSFPNIEPYFTGDLMHALKNDVHKDVELIFGYNEDEGLLPISICFDLKNTLFAANNFKEHFVPKHLALYCSPNDQLDIGNIFKQFYMQKNQASFDNIDQLAKFYGTDMFTFGVWQAAKFFSRKNKVYFYKFTCKSERNFTSKIISVSELFKDKCLVSHNEEIAYLFPVKKVKQKINKNSEAFKLINYITKLWTNFAKTGNPTPDGNLGIYWKQFQPESQAYLDIGNKLAKRFIPDGEELGLWESVFQKYLPDKTFFGDQETTNHEDS